MVIIAILNTGVEIYCYICFRDIGIFQHNFPITSLCNDTVVFQRKEMTNKMFTRCKSEVFDTSVDIFSCYYYFYNNITTVIVIFDTINGSESDCDINR